jgi:hypothetical protein
MEARPAAPNPSASPRNHADAAPACSRDTNAAMTRRMVSTSGLRAPESASWRLSRERPASAAPRLMPLARARRPTSSRGGPEMFGHVEFRCLYLFRIRLEDFPPANAPSPRLPDSLSSPFFGHRTRRCEGIAGENAMEFGAWLTLPRCFGTFPSLFQRRHLPEPVTRSARRVLLENAVSDDVLDDQTPGIDDPA